MIFIESAVFTTQVRELLSDGNYAQFQQCLAAHPRMGDVIEGTGGLRKVRCQYQGAARAVVCG